MVAAAIDHGSEKHIEHSLHFIKPPKVIMVATPFRAFDDSSKSFLTGPSLLNGHLGEDAEWLEDIRVLLEGRQVDRLISLHDLSIQPEVVGPSANQRKSGRLSLSP